MVPIGNGGVPGTCREGVCGKGNLRSHPLVPERLSFLENPLLFPFSVSSPGLFYFSFFGIV